MVLILAGIPRHMGESGCLRPKAARELVREAVPSFVFPIRVPACGSSVPTDPGCNPTPVKRLLANHLTIATTPSPFLVIWPVSLY